MDYYEILGVSKNASEKEIKSAFRKKAAQLHPDRNKAVDAAEQFKKANEAYQVLSDPQKRTMYDQYGSAAFSGGNGGFNPFSGAGGRTEFQFDFSDLFGGGFNDVFGESSPFSDLFGRRGGRSSKNQNTGQDVFINLAVQLEDVIKGNEKEISYNRKERCKNCNGAGGSKVETCNKCGGSGRVRQVTRSFFGNMEVMRECPECSGTGKKVLEKCPVCHGDSVITAVKNLKIKIPEGIESGVNLRFKGEGHAGKYGASAGDLFIQINIQKDKRFRRINDDLEVDISLPIYSLVLGDEIELDTFDGLKKVKIPQGMNVGEKLVLRELGVPNFHTKKRGSIVLDIKVEIPKKLSKEEQELYKNLQELDHKKDKRFWKF